MSQRTQTILNTITLFITLLVNAWAGIVGMNGVSVGVISAKYETLMTPAGYAFSIWSVIYLGLIVFVGYQWYELRRNGKMESDTGVWFSLANIANALWLVVWLKESIGLSVVIMFLLLLALVKLVVRLNMECWDAPLRVIGFVWWPITFYLGWIVLASVTNVAAYLVSIGFTPAPVAMTIVMIAVASFIYIFLTYTRNLRETCLVGVWGLIAIAVKQGNDYPDIMYAAIAACMALFVTAAIHGYKNRETSPFKKWQRKEI